MTQADQIDHGMRERTRSGEPSILASLLRSDEDRILDEWVHQQTSSTNGRNDLIGEAQIEEDSREFLSAFVEAASNDGFDNLNSRGWSRVREILTSMSRSRTLVGFSPAEIATFVFSLKQPLFDRLRATVDNERTLAEEIWRATVTLDALGLFTTEVYQRSREEVIARQQQELVELSTPVVKLWEGVLALPLIGTLDSSRTQVVMESLLQRIVETGSRMAIIDITGVPTVDTLVAQHLLKTVAAARLMGADCIISGIRPQIAQTIVHLGVQLADVVTKSSMADAFMLALGRNGYEIVRTSHAA